MFLHYATNFFPFLISSSKIDREVAYWQVLENGLKIEVELEKFLKMLQVIQQVIQTDIELPNF